MIRRGQIFVRALVPPDWTKYENVDILDLDEDSFRALLLSKLDGMFVKLKDEFAGEEVELKASGKKYFLEEFGKREEQETHDENEY